MSHIQCQVSHEFFFTGGPVINAAHLSSLMIIMTFTDTIFVGPVAVLQTQLYLIRSPSDSLPKHFVNSLKAVVVVV